jgi:hypothetical protein
MGSPFEGEESKGFRVSAGDLAEACAKSEEVV